MNAKIGVKPIAAPLSLVARCNREIPLLPESNTEPGRPYCFALLRTLAVYGPVHVYPNPIPPADYPGSNFIAVIGPNDSVKVLQIIRSRDHTAVRIRLSDGRKGWVFSGESISHFVQRFRNRFSSHKLRSPKCGIKIGEIRMFRQLSTQAEKLFFRRREQSIAAPARLTSQSD